MYYRDRKEGKSAPHISLAEMPEYARGKHFERFRPVWRLAHLLFALSLMTGWTSIRETSVANATIIPALQPVLVLLVASRLFAERIRARDLALGACGLVGVLAFVAVSSDTSAPSASLRTMSCSATSLDSCAASVACSAT